MKQAFKRILSLALALLMVVVLLPAGLVTSAYALDDIQQTEDCTATVQAAASPSVQPQADVSADAAATFSVDNKSYTDLNAAIDAAVNGDDKTIVVAADGTLSGDYTIPAGVTLLVPFDSANTLYTTKPGSVKAEAAQSAFRTLTLTDDASITVNGAISVGGKLYTSTSTHVCKPTGAYGQIKMSGGSQITVANGGALYAWGYITGSGNVRITSGATVYECFQVTDWRGGTATLGFFNPEDVNKVFPFTQYYVQNVEAPLTIEYGGSEKAFIAAYNQKMAIDFVGAKGMFELAEGASLTKTYDPAADRISFDISGNASLKGIKMKVLFVTIDSANYVLPITNNVNINIHSGVTTISQDVALLPGVQVTIDQGAELNIQEKANLYVYDADQWSKDYVWGSNNGISPVAYSPSGKGSRAVSDTAINVNGVLNVAGSVYTTTGGADIHSGAGTGQYVQAAVPRTAENTYQCTQSSSGVTPVAIPITPAKLHNADGTYTETTASNAGDTYVYANGKWVVKGSKIAINFVSNGGTGTMNAMRVNAGFDNTLPANAFTRADYTFTGWNTEANGSGTAYADGTTVNFNADTTLYAQWTQNPVITFYANGGDGLMPTQTVQPGAAAALTANAFTRADYDFAGWNTAADGTGTTYADGADITASENVTLYAQWKLHKYHVRWLNWNGSVLQEGDYTCEDYAEWNMANDVPEKPEDEDYAYSFAGRWTPYDAAEGIDGRGFYPHKNVDFTAVFRQTAKLTVTFDANGGTGTMAPVKTLSGKEYVLPECSFTREGYTFDGWLITGTVGYTQFDKFQLTEEKWDDDTLLAFSNLILKASWKVNAYTVTWKSDDGTVLKTTTVNYGEMPSYDGTPVKAETPYYSYEFTGWDKELTAVTGDVTYTAQFRPVGKNGLCIDGDDTYWLENGQIVKDKGLTQVKDAQGHNLYYYFGADGKAVKNVLPDSGHDFWITKEKTNGLLPEWGYYFDENGVIPHDEQFQNGIVTEGDAKYYYIDGIRVHMGMFRLDGSYYYARSSGQLVTGREYYCERMGDSGLKEGLYAFDADGKLLLQKKGIVAENGSLYYYEYGVRTYAGLIKIGDSYYYVKTSGEVVHGRSYWITKTNGLMPERSYTFADDGRMLDPEIKDTAKDGIVAENDSLYYYVDGLRTYAGLIKIGDSYYYAKTSGEVVHGRSYWITKTNGLMPERSYTFADDGKMLDPEFKDVTKSGIVAEDGSLYYYVDGLRTYAGLIKIGDSYYYVKTSGEVVHGRSYWITKTNGLMPERSYTFADDGKMIDPELKDVTKSGIVAEDGSLYYYVDGLRTYAGLIEIDGSYYYVKTSGEVVHGRSYWITKTNGLMPERSYTFAEDGKMIDPEIKDTAKDGIVSEDGSLYYYKDGLRTYAGLIEIDGSYYYVKTSGEVVHGRSYWITKTNGLMAERSYTFTDDGKMIDPGK